jgi:hypothetical protein
MMQNKFLVIVFLGLIFSTHAFAEDDVFDQLDKTLKQNASGANKLSRPKPSPSGGYRNSQRNVSHGKERDYATPIITNSDGKGDTVKDYIKLGTRLKCVLVGKVSNLSGVMVKAKILEDYKGLPTKGLLLYGAVVGVQRRRMIVGFTRMDHPFDKEKTIDVEGVSYSLKDNGVGIIADKIEERTENNIIKSVLGLGVDFAKIIVDINTQGYGSKVLEDSGVEKNVRGQLEDIETKRLMQIDRGRRFLMEVSKPILIERTLLL